MLAKLNTFALVGIDAVPVEVEVDNSYAQMPKTIIVGLPELAVRESVHRIERALANLRYERPNGRPIVRRRRGRSTCRWPWECSSPRDRCWRSNFGTVRWWANWPSTAAYGRSR